MNTVWIIQPNTVLAIRIQVDILQHLIIAANNQKPKISHKTKICCGIEKMTQKLSELQSLVVVGKNVQNNSETLTFHGKNVEKWLHRIELV